MIRVAICDDELKEIEYAHRLLTQYMREHPQYEIEIHSFSAPLELLCHVEEHGEFDILLLDVFMAGMLGTDVARELRCLGDEVEIIFFTASRDHSIDAFEVDAAQYLIKPCTQVRLFATLDKVMQRINVDKLNSITLKTSEGITRIAPHNVVFTETNRNNYQTIHTIQGKTIEVRITSAELFNLLSKNKYFIKCGASLNLNLKYVRQISKGVIVLDTGEHLSFPYRSYPMLKEKFLSFQMDNEE